MSTRLFVGSLAYSVTNEELEEFFAVAGNVSSAKVIVDHESNRSKGFGFVEMATEEEAQAAIQQLDGKDLNGRPVAVSEAKPQERRERRPFNGGSNGGGNRGERSFQNDRRY